MFQVTVDMLTFFVSLVTIVDSVSVELGFNTINVVKILIYVACETNAYINMCNAYVWQYNYIDSCAVAIPIISYVVTIISFLLSMIAYRLVQLL